ncbi:unnamed protein product, partial [Linum tenue]
QIFFFAFPSHLSSQPHNFSSLFLFLLQKPTTHLFLSPSLCTRTKKKKKQKGRIEEEEDAGSRRTRRRRNPHPTPPHLCSPSLFSLLSDVVSFSLCDLKSPKSPMKRQTCQGRRVIRRLVG